MEEHISLLHEYNDLKDVGQMLLGKLGEQQALEEPPGIPEYPHP